MSMLQFDEIIFESGDEFDDGFNMLIFYGLLLISERELMSEIMEKCIDAVYHRGIDMATLIIMEDKIVEGIFWVEFLLLLGFAI